MIWISVEDEMPNELQTVICLFSGGEIDTGIYTGKCFIDTCCACKRYLVTHWMPLPEPPSE